MTVSINNKLGIGGGGGAELNVAEIAAAIAGALPTSSVIQPGQILKFREGKVPEGYAQINGPAVPPAAAGVIGVESFQARTGHTSTFRLLATDSRLFITSAAYVREMTPELDLIAGAAAQIPGLSSSWTPTPNLVAAPNGNLLRVGGSSSGSTGKLVSLYDPAKLTWTTVAPRATDANADFWIGAFAGDGCLYMHAGMGGQTIDQFDLNANTWTYGVDAFPSTETPLGMCSLPSGKIFVAYRTAQYVFDPLAVAGSRWTQVGAVAVSTSNTNPVMTATGARFYDTGVTTNGVTLCMAFCDYSEYTGIVTLAKPALKYYNMTGAPQSMRATRNPYTGAVVMQNAVSYDYLFHHFMNYTPAATVEAVKL